jgi:beta-1,3-galactosyltransferase 1
MKVILKSKFVIIITTLKIVLGLRIVGRYEHSREELELTKIVRIEQSCQDSEFQIFVHSAARTSGKYYDRRQTTRQTWVRDAIHNNMKVTFVLAEAQDEQTQNQIITESEKYKDILQFGFKDDYHNLTLKAIALLGWISLNCLVGDYIVKTDDDILININRLKEKIDNKTFQNGITGKLFKDSKPVRDINSEYANKWLVPKDLYPEDYYPPYLSGAAYVMSTDIIEKLYKSSINNSGPILDIDDLYLTGIIAEKYNIQRHDNSEFYSSNSDGGYCGIEVCKMYTLLTLHGCESVNETLLLWNSWKNCSMESCEYYFDKLHRNTLYGTIAFIVAIVLLIIFILSMIGIICQYYTNYRDWQWQKVVTNVL